MPPKLTQRELTEALRLIVARRRKIDDPQYYLLPDPDQADVHEVLVYLRRYPTKVRWVQQADAVHALTLCVWMWWEDRRRELYWLTTGLSRGLFLSQLGSPLGVGRQGVRDRIDRVSALLRYDRPDEKLAREERRIAAVKDAARDAELAWLDAHTVELQQVVAGLSGAADRYGLAEDERDMLDELVVDAKDDAWSPGSMALLGLAVSEVATAPAVAALAEGAQPCTVHRVLARADALRADFGGLGMTEYRRRVGTAGRRTANGKPVQPKCRPS